MRQSRCYCESGRAVLKLGGGKAAAAEPLLHGESGRAERKKKLKAAEPHARFELKKSKAADPDIANK